MTTPSNNPFVFPGLGGPGAGNPLLQGLDMMRSAWGGMTPAGGLNPALTQPTLLDPAEIDRRIAELQAVESWLTLNLGMLQGAIRALEVQRATLSTLRSFASLGGFGNPAAPAAGEANAPSPLEVALGLRHPSAPAEPAPDATAAAAPASEAAAAPAAGAAAFTDPAQAAAAQQAWWNLLQQQFNQIASAASATFPVASTAPAAADAAPSHPAPQPKPASKRASKSPPVATATKAARKSRRQP